MRNPWEEINLSDYENHMSLDSVYQLQILNQMMKEQFCTYEAKTAMVLGVAGGNGIEHIEDCGFEKVYGIDVNEEFLLECRNRYKKLENVFETICVDLLSENLQLPHSKLLIANLLIEYIGYECFQRVVNIVKPQYISCIIQINTGEAFVSDSPYIHSFDCLEQVHHQMQEDELTKCMSDIGYRKETIIEQELPNGKKFIRIDYIKTKAVIFDMFETLITHYNCPLYFGAQMAKDAGISEIKFQELWRPTESDRTIGNITLEQIIEKILKENQCYSEELLNLIVSKRKATKEECFNNLHKDILPMLKKLKEQGILVGLISNCFSEEAEVIRKSILFPYFDVICLSYEEGVQKPDVEIYKRCMNRLSVNAAECIYVGDGGSRELETARELGMKALQATWYLREGTFQPTGRMKDFCQLENPLDIFKYI